MELQSQGILLERNYPTLDRRCAVAQLNEHPFSSGGRAIEPVQVVEHDLVTEQLSFGADDHFVGLRPYTEHVKRPVETPAEAFALADSVSRVTGVLADGFSSRGDQPAWQKRGVVAAEAFGQELGVIARGDEADLLGLGLVGRGKLERTRARAHFRLRQLAD